MEYLFISRYITIVAGFQIWKPATIIDILFNSNITNTISGTHHKALISEQQTN